MDATDKKAESLEEVTTSEIDEGTAAADTLKPKAGSSGTESKSQMLDTFVKLMAQLGKEDMTKFFNDSMAQIGHEADKVGDNAAKNRASVAAKPSAAKGAVKEDLDEIFSEETEELSEDFRDKASTLFEAALNTRINLETVRLEEEFGEKETELREELSEELQTKANEIFEEVTEKLDQYLNYNVEEYMKENKVALETALRAEIAENFIHGLQNLFSEHYITVPEEKINLLGEMKAEIDSLKDKLNESINSKMELEAALKESVKSQIVSEATEGLTVSQKEKLTDLAEGVEETDPEAYAKKVGILKESYFGKKTITNNTGLITEEIDGDVEELEEDASTGAKTPTMDAYLKHIAKNK